MAITSVKSKKKLVTEKRKTSLRTEIWRCRYMYLLLIPGILYFVLFRYLPIAWLGISFQDFKLLKGITGSEFVGFSNYLEFFKSPDFWMLIKNTLILNLYSIIFEFPAVIIFALIVNEVRNTKFKKIFQTVSYLPHFISTVVLVGMINTMLSSVPPGSIYKFIYTITGGNITTIIGQEKFFRLIYVLSSIWQQTGWSAIVYLAALAGIDPTYYEAAIVDGASRFRQMIHITLPCIMNTIIMMLIVKIGNIMTLGVDKAYLMGTDATRQVSEIISTYVYKRGMINHDYSYSTAVGLFNSLIGLVLVVFANKVSKKVSDYGGLW